MPIPNDYTRKLFEVLKECARDMYTESYGVLAVRIGMKPGAGKALRLHLGYIRDEICAERELPPLNELAVNKKSWRPGASVLPAKYKVPTHSKEVHWRGMVVSVFSYPWHEVTFDQPE